MKTHILNNAHILGQNNMAANVLKPSRDYTARGLIRNQKYQIGQVTRNVKEQEATLKLEAKRTQLTILKLPSRIGSFG